MKGFVRLLCVAAGTCLALWSGASGSGTWSTSSGSCFGKGDKRISAGLALWPFGANAAFDYAFHDVISGGGGIGVKTSYFTPGSSFFVVAARAAFHPFNLAVLADKIKVRDKFDVFVGIAPHFGIGFDGPPHYEWGAWPYAGGRWQFSPKVSLYAEECAGLGDVCAGFNFKL
jgi:hypothetical protein